MAIKDKFLDSIISLFSDKIFSSTRKPFLTPEDIQYFSLPYTGLHCIQSELNLKNFFPLVFHGLMFALFFALPSAYPPSFHSKPVFIWSEIACRLFIKVSMLWRIVCWPNMPTFAHAHFSPTWEYRLWTVSCWADTHFLPFLITITTLVIL